jgi:hypothetical protein
MIGRDPVAHREIQILHQVEPALELDDSQQLADDLIRGTENIFHDVVQDETDEADCPFLPIHQPKHLGFPFLSGSNISRSHAKIFYDANEERFMIHVLGKNGLFIGTQMFNQEDVVSLINGDEIRIGQVSFKFYLPPDDSDSEDDSRGPGSTSGKMSFGFDNGLASSDDEGSVEQDAYHMFRLADGEMDEDDQGEDDDDDDDSSTSSIAPIRKQDRVAVSKKSGLKIYLKSNGDSKDKKRPPPIVTSQKAVHGKAKKSPTKDKEPATTQAASAEPSSATQAKDADLAEKVLRVARDEPLKVGEDIHVEGLPAGFVLPPRKKGPGRPPKDGIISKRERHVLMKQHKERGKAKEQGLEYTEPEAEPIKKSNRPRKDSDGNDIEGGDDLSKKLTDTDKDTKPTPRVEDYTEDQLQKPTGTYQTILYEMITNWPDKKMNLPQIYEEMMRRWPYYRFRCATVGWQSSVRHNLGSNAVFKKFKKDGKGHIWTINDEVEYEPAKKDKPPQSYPPPPQQMPGNHVGHVNGTGPSSYTHPQANHHMMHSNQRAMYGQAPMTGAQHRPAHPGAPMPYGTNPANRPNMQTTPAARPPNGPPMNQPHGTNVNRQANYSTQYTSPANRGGYWNPLYPHNGNQKTPGMRTSTPRPSEEVVSVFKNVFKKSINKGEMSEEQAQKIVDYAVKRVLDPESMVDVPYLDKEEPVIAAFRSCIEKSQVPPRVSQSSSPGSYQHHLSHSQLSGHSRPVASPLSGSPALHSTTPVAGAPPTAVIAQALAQQLSAPAATRTQTTSPNPLPKQPAAATAPLHTPPPNGNATVVPAVPSLSPAAIAAALANPPLSKPPQSPSRKRSVNEDAEQSDAKRIQ